MQKRLLLSHLKQLYQGLVETRYIIECKICNRKSSSKEMHHMTGSLSAQTAKRMEFVAPTIKLLSSFSI